jgi:hypothetical protein
MSGGWRLLTDWSARSRDCLFDPRRHAQLAHEDRRAPAGRATPRLPRLVDGTAQPLERVVAKCPAHSRTDLLQVDPDRLDELGVGSRRPQRGGERRCEGADLGQKPRHVVGQEVAASGEREEQVLSAEPALASLAGLLQRGVDDQSRVRVTAFEHAYFLRRPRRTWCFLWTD